jgi:hypothetical protein
MSVNQLQPEQAAGILKTLFIGAEIITFEFWADFILRIQRGAIPQQQQPKVTIPPIFCLRLESDWWVGDRKQWDESQKLFPIRELRRISANEVPKRSAVIGQMLGSTITDLRVAADGTLTIYTSDDATLTVPGVSQAHDYSWSVELPEDDIQRNEWSFVCEINGQLYGRLPASKLA